MVKVLIIFGMASYRLDFIACRLYLLCSHNPLLLKHNPERFYTLILFSILLQCVITDTIFFLLFLLHINIRL